MTLLPGIDPFPQDPAARVKASSAWYTPPEAARVLAGMCTSSRLRLPQGKPWRILEPSAGRGALLQALIDEQSPCAPTIVDAIDLDPRTAEHLNQQPWPLDVRVDDETGAITVTVGLLGEPITITTPPITRQPREVNKR